MSVQVGEVTTIPMWESADKAQAVKILEESAEVFGAWQDWKNEDDPELIEFIVNECADLITATCNLLAGLGFNDITNEMLACAGRNHERGRL